MLTEKHIDRIIQCHLDSNDPETFVVGKLIEISDEWFLMQDVSYLGKWNGLALYETADIVSVSTENEYINKLQFLLKHRNEDPFSISMPKDNLLKNVLLFAAKHRKAISLETCSSGCRDVIGFVDKIEHENVKILQYDEFGRADGISYVDMKEITRCFIGDEDLICLEILVKGHWDISPVP